jgi:hypothetical protein
MPQKLEPIFTRQEQGVVYLFSRYWEKIPGFEKKKIIRIHTHFPDFSILNADGGEEAIEFEYGLSSFCSHCDAGKCLRKLHEKGIRLLHIVYWDEDYDEKELRRRIKKAGFTGKVNCVCLKECFKAFVGRNRESYHWYAAWVFSNVTAKPVYDTQQIVDATNRLERQEVIKRLEISKGLYRTIGFDKNSSLFIECDHWRSIHFFTTTTRFAEDSIPCKLFVKPNGCDYFDGYFEIKSAFKIRKADETVKQFFKKYYFYGYDEYDEEYERSTCFVYSDFKLLNRERGKKLFSFLLAKKYNLGVRGSIKIRPEGYAAIDRVFRA